jgi:hypothetical protein
MFTRVSRVSVTALALSARHENCDGEDREIPNSHGGPSCPNIARQPTAETHHCCKRTRIWGPSRRSRIASGVSAAAGDVRRGRRDDPQARRAEHDGAVQGEEAAADPHFQRRVRATSSQTRSMRTPPGPSRSSRERQVGAARPMWTSRTRSVSARVASAEWDVSTLSFCILASFSQSRSDQAKPRGIGSRARGNTSGRIAPPAA